jgi:hypothetical protein
VITGSARLLRLSSERVNETEVGSDAGSCNELGRYGRLRSDRFSGKLISQL